MHERPPEVYVEKRSPSSRRVSGLVGSEELLCTPAAAFAGISTASEGLSELGM